MENKTQINMTTKKTPNKGNIKIKGKVFINENNSMPDDLKGSFVVYQMP